MFCSARHHRIARASVTSTSTSTSRVDAPVTRKAVVVRSRGRSGRVSTRASGDDGNGRGQDVQNDWDGAWRAFKRDFVGEDAKMPGDYVETRFKSKRYVWNVVEFFARHPPFPSRAYVCILTYRRALARPGASVPSPRAQTLSGRRRQATDLRRRGSRIKFRHIQLLFHRRRHRCRRFTLPLRRRHRSAPQRRSVFAPVVRLSVAFTFTFTFTFSCTHAFTRSLPRVVKPNHTDTQGSTHARTHARTHAHRVHRHAFLHPSVHQRVVWLVVRVASRRALHSSNFRVAFRPNVRVFLAF